MTAHMLAASLPAATKTKGCRSVNPFIRIHARILLQSLSSISPTTGPIRRPQCSSFAKDLDYSAVGSLEVAKPCCHRSTARHHLVAERRGVNANVYQTGVCQFSDTKTQHDTKGSNTCNIQQQEIIIIPQTTWHGCLTTIMAISTFPLQRNETDPSPHQEESTLRIHLETLPSSESPSPPFPPCTDSPPPPGPLAFSPRPTLPTQEISHFLDLAALHRIKMHACMPRRAERTTPADHYHCHCLSYLPILHSSRQSIAQGHPLNSHALPPMTRHSLAIPVNAPSPSTA